eukprot:ANDGO_06360.mRNA.1 Kinesin-like protein KLP1
MGKSAVKVCIRTRPTTNFAQDQLLIDPSADSITVDFRRRQAGGILQNQQDVFPFRFDSVLHNSSQEAVYDSVASEIVQSVLDGYNGTIMCYGQTGAGKTFTMIGGSSNFKYRGLVPRSLAHVYREIAAHPEQAVTVRISYLEIYNDQMFDLLNPQNEGKLEIQEDGLNTSVKGLMLPAAPSEEDALALLFEGETNRTIAEHSLNARSTRSHCIFTVHIESRSRVESNGKVTYSKLNLVDLAGSERVGKTHSTGTTLKEANFINRSLSFLEQVVIALGTPSREHIPYRQTRLTNVLKDSLGGNCKTLLIANIWAEPQCLDETISTLKFATRMMRVQNEPVQNVSMDAQAQVKVLERQVRDLRQELAMIKQLSGQSSNTASYEPLGDSDKHELQSRVLSFVKGEGAEDAIMDKVESFYRFREVLGMFREAFRAIQAQNRSLSSSMGGGMVGPGVGALGRENSAGSAKGGRNQGPGVGEVDAQGSLAATGVGAPAAEFLTRRKTDLSASQNLGSQSPTSQPQHQQRDASAEQTEASSRPEKKVAFEDYKNKEGAEIALQLREGLAQLKDKKRASKDIALRVNECVKEIDRLKKQLGARQVAKGGSFNDQDDNGTSKDIILDEEEFALFRDLKNQKRQYKEAFGSLRETKSEVEYLERMTDQARQQLIVNFEEWYLKTFGGDGEAAEQEQDDDMMVGMVTSGKTRRMNSTATEDVMDEAEKFEQLEMDRILSEDPESAAFYGAKKKFALHSSKSRPSVQKRKV